MSTTYTVESDITKAEPSATDYLPASDSGSFDRLRVLAYNEINRRLARRNPPVDYTECSDTTELNWAEVCHVLRDLFEQAASRAQNDLLWVQAKEWGKRWDDEIQNAPVTVSGDSADGGVSQGASIEIQRS